MRYSIALALAMLLAAAASPEAATEPRVALVVGNGTYVNAGALRNPPNDAKAMSTLLRRAGFEVIERENATRRGMIEALRSFAQKLSSGGVGLFYYAGHGIQARGVNYLVPIDAALAAEDDLRYEAFDVQDVLDRMDEAHVRLSLVILDACRDNPFLRSVRSISNARGLAPLAAPSGTLVAYATAPGKVAADGEGDNGIYTSELLQAMSVPGLKLQEVFERVIDAVERKTARMQTPWISSSFRGDFYFLPPSEAAPGGAPSALGPVAVLPPAGEDRQIEAVFWSTIKDSTSAADFADYLKRYPQGAFASLARRKLEGLQSMAQLQAAPASLPQEEGTFGAALGGEAPVFASGCWYDAAMGPEFAFASRILEADPAAPGRTRFELVALAGNPIHLEKSAEADGTGRFKTADGRITILDQDTYEESPEPTRSAAADLLLHPATIYKRTACR